MKEIFNSKKPNKWRELIGNRKTTRKVVKVNLNNINYFIKIIRCLWILVQEKYTNIEVVTIFMVIITIAWILKLSFTINKTHLPFFHTKWWLHVHVWWLLETFWLLLNDKDFAMTLIFCPNITKPKNNLHIFPWLLPLIILNN